MSAEMLTATIASILAFLTIVANGFFQSQREKRRDALTVENRKLDIAERAATAAHVVAKIDENTEVSVKAFDVANNVNEKIAAGGVASNDVARELRSLRAAVEETRRLLHLGLSGK
jgi:hypothetical protein